MSQERLNGLTILCIEKNMLEHIDVDTIINVFAFNNTSRIYFICVVGCLIKFIDVFPLKFDVFIK